MSSSTLAGKGVSTRSKAGHAVSKPFLVGAVISALIWTALGAASTISVGLPAPELPSVSLSN